MRLDRLFSASMFTALHCIALLVTFVLWTYPQLIVELHSNACINTVTIQLLTQQAESMQPLRPYEKLDTLQQFLNYDRHVLRFYCQWDDSQSMFGDARWLELHYFLADDTVEILEKIPPNSGRDAVPVFLRRARLPKVSHTHLF